ncbi:MAG: T9SS type A sorting domain-containing protein [Chitinophagales bacterium]|nr:T9SS type A sorting domain-containing protein [Chitinophagales bacterium]
MFSISSVLFAQSNSRLMDADMIKVYPNPISTEAIIKLSDAIDKDNHKVSVTFYNVVGKEILKISNIKESEIRFNRENFVSGMYIYQLRIDDRTQYTGRITVK